ncbi:MAG TPA: DUF6632 domain-containing protein [Terriglobales bacterium]
MNRERALKILLVLVGSIFTAAIYPVTMILWERDHSAYTDAMMGSLYITLGILLLMAVRNPSAHRSLIAFAGWSSIAHAIVMTIMVSRDGNDREHLLLGVAIFAVVGIPLILLIPAKQFSERASAVGT